MRLLRMITVAALAAGLVGVVDPPFAGAGTTGAPTPKESIDKAVRRVEKAVKSGTCKSLKLLSHSGVRTDPKDPSKPVKPTKKLTADECDRMKTFAESIEGFEATKSQEYGTGAVVEGEKDGESFLLTYALDVDGKWKPLTAGPFDPQIGTTGTLDFLGTVNAFIAALQADNCQEVWRLLVADSTYVTARQDSGGAEKLCEDLETSIARGTGRIYDLTQGAGTPEQFAALSDVGIFGVETDSGRYLTFILFSELAGETEHADPGVYEFVTTRQPTR